MSKLIIRSIGIDVHKDSYSLSAFDPENASFSAECRVAADSKSVINVCYTLKTDNIIIRKSPH